APELSVFVQALWAGNRNIVLQLLLEGLAVDTRIEDGVTPLMLAAAAGHAEIVKLLLDYGADLAARDDENNTALLFAVQGGYSEVVQVLLDAGAARDDEAVRVLFEPSLEGRKSTLTPPKKPTTTSKREAAKSVETANASAAPQPESKQRKAKP